MINNSSQNDRASKSGFFGNGYSNDGNVTESQIRKIVQDELKKKNTGVPTIQRHFHDDIDSPKINEANILGTRINSGTITFSQQTTYTLAVNFNPKSILIYGNVVDGTGNIKGQIIGNALLQGAFYMAPGTSISTKVASTIQNIAQSSSYFLVDNSSGTHVSHTLASQTNIVDVFYNSTLFVRMTVVSASGKGIVLNVSTLSSGWSINANFSIT